MTTITENQVVSACQTLFGRDIDISRDFLYHSMQPSGVKSAYRKKAKENHPDLFAAEPLHVQKKQTALFREILQAYDVLTLFFKQRETGGWRAGIIKQPPRPRDKKPASAHSHNASQSAVRKCKEDDIYYNGSVPFRTLQIGQYLYYCGKISFGLMINALVWQRRQRPSIGDIAVEWGLLDREGVNKIFSLCSRARLFGEKAVDLGLLTVFQVNTILLYQRSQQLRLGKYFVQNNILTSEEMERRVQELKEHNARVLAAANQKQPLHAGRGTQSQAH